MKYFIHGNEPYLIHQRKLQVRSDAEKSGADCEFFSLADVLPGDIAALAFNSSLFNAKKCVFIDNLEKAAEKIKMLGEFFKKKSDEVDLIFIWNGKLKSVQMQSLPLSVIASDSLIFEESLPNRPMLVAWIKNKFGEYGKKIKSDAAEFLAAEMPDDMWALSCEIEKCAMYALEKHEISAEEIKKNLYQKGTGNFFLFSKSIENGNEKEAVKTLEKLLLGGEKPLVITDRIYKTFQKIYLGKYFLNRGLEKQEIAKILFLHHYYDSNFFNNLKNYDSQQLKKIFELISTCNFKLKRLESIIDEKYVLLDLSMRVFRV